MLTVSVSLGHVFPENAFRARVIGPTKFKSERLGVKIGLRGSASFKDPVIPDGKVQTKESAFKVPLASIVTESVPQVVTSSPASAIGVASILMVICSV